MIDQAKLNALSVDTLIELKDRIHDTIMRKQRSALRIGQVVAFDSQKHGREVRIKITNFGPKNVMGYELDAQGKFKPHPRGYDWRVHPSVCRPITATPSGAYAGAGSF